MSESASNPFWRFLVGVGKVINFINHLVFNVFMLLFLLVLFALLAIMMAAKSGSGGGGGLTPVLDKTALVLDLDGTLVEQYTSAPISRAIAQASGGRDAGREIQLRDVVQALAIASVAPVAAACSIAVAKSRWWWRRARSPTATSRRARWGASPPPR